MSTRLKDQALDVSVVEEQGLGGLRYYDDKLQVFENGEWVTIINNDPKVPVESISITVHGSSEQGDWSINKSGESFFCAEKAFWCEATVLPENATDKSVTWSMTSTDSRDTGTINPETGVLTPNDGDAFKYYSVLTITATANDGSGVIGTISGEARAVECSGAPK